LEYLESSFGVKINIIARSMPVLDSFEIKAAVPQARPAIADGPPVGPGNV
jgi:hypothetical protein